MKNLNVKVPATKPNWRGGKYSVLKGDEHQGYFRTFTGAWHWRNYLAATSEAGTELRVQEWGQTVNVMKVGDSHTLADWTK